jgi:hypothetical protein
MGRIKEWWQRVRIVIEVAGGVAVILAVAFWRTFRRGISAGEAQGSGVEREKEVREAEARGDTGPIDDAWRK